jgi:S-adenosylmethionine hydrolase
VTNLDRRSCEKITNGHAVIEVRIGGKSVSHLVATYADLPPGEIGVLFGSTDHLECAAQASSAADALGVRAGDPVELRRG